MNATAILDTLLEASVRAVVLAGLVALTLAAFRVKAPSVRHAAWTAALLVMLLLPTVSGVLPTWPLPAWMPDVPVRMPRLETASVVQQADALASIPAAGLRQTNLAPVAAPIAPAWAAAAVSQPEPATAAVGSWTWRNWTVLAWFLVACLFLLRELAGAWMAHGLSASGIPVEGDARTFQSPNIITPVVVGVLKPRVMVPASWPRWGAGVREMVLLHERAHVIRHDPLVACLARVNRAVLWFHPVAWWLERHLARVSEQACDELVMHAVPEPRLYAAMLVEMAKRLHQHGQRVVWQGIGVVDSRRFEDRVSRVLSGPSPQLSRARKMALAAMSAFLVAVAVACGTSAAPLAEDPELAKEIAAMEAYNNEGRSAIMTTVDDLPALEKAVADNPGDMAATRRILGFYRNHGQKLLGWDKAIEAQRPHLLRVIERDPESPQAGWPLSRRHDPEGYAQARALWMAHVEKAGVTSVVLAQAAQFFMAEEPFVAEQLLLRGQAVDPKGPPRDNARMVMHLSWSSNLGRLYARGILGSSEGPFAQVTPVDPELAKGPFAQHARKVLDATSDASMLTAAAQFLHYQGRIVTLDFDQHALARTYAERAAAIRPGGPAQFLLDRFDEEGNYDRMVRLLGASAWEVKDAAFEPLSDELKLRYANGLIWGPHGDLMQAYQRKDDAGIQSALTSFEKRARHMLEVVARAPKTNLNSRVEADAHIALGTVAMRRGKTADAVAHLQQAALAGRPMEKVDGVNDDTNSLGNIAAQRLTHELLSAGERETVAAFYESAAKTLMNQQRTEYETAAAAIRAGRMPAAYQRYVARIK